MIAIRNLAAPSHCHECFFRNPSTNACNLDPDILINETTRPYECPICDVQTLQWRHILSPQELAWREIANDLSMKSLTRQAGDEFIRTMMKSSIIDGYIFERKDGVYPPGTVEFRSRVMVVDPPWRDKNKDEKEPEQGL